MTRICLNFHRTILLPKAHLVMVFLRSLVGEKQSMYDDVVFSILF